MRELLIEANLEIERLLGHVSVMQPLLGEQKIEIERLQSAVHELEDQLSETESERNERGIERDSLRTEVERLSSLVGIATGTGDTTTKLDWIEEGRGAAEECWCDEETNGIQMDARLAESVARRIAFWMGEAARENGNVVFYRGLLDECAEHLGPDVYRSDDGSIQEDPIHLKIPELVKELSERDSGPIQEVA